MRVRFNIPLDT